MLEQVYKTLVTAHGAGFHHGDVRPSNLIVVRRSDAEGGGVDAVDVYLVDWGLGEDPTTSSTVRPRKRLHGVRAFMADDKVRLTAETRNTMWLPDKRQDMHALLYTFAAVLSSANAEPPWCHGYVGNEAAIHMIAERRAWIAQHMPLSLVPEVLRVAWEEVGGNAE